MQMAFNKVGQFRFGRDMTQENSQGRHAMDCRRPSLRATETRFRAMPFNWPLEGPTKRAPYDGTHRSRHRSQVKDQRERSLGQCATVRENLSPRADEVAGRSGKRATRDFLRGCNLSQRTNVVVVRAPLLVASLLVGCARTGPGPVDERIRRGSRRLRRSLFQES